MSTYFGLHNILETAVICVLSQIQISGILLSIQKKFRIEEKLHDQELGNSFLAITPRSIRKRKNRQMRLN